MQNPGSQGYPKRLFVCLIGSALALSVLIVCLSTHIRLGEAGLGCQPWPDCYARLSFADGVKGLAIADTAFKTFRLLHRYTASILGVNILLIMLLALRYRRAISPWLPIVMFLLVLFLSVLGVVTPTRSVPLVTLGNILGGIVLCGLLWRQLRQMRAPSRHAGPRLLALVSATLSLQLISGAWASANYTASACPGLTICTHTTDIPGYAVASMNVFRRLPLDRDDHLVIDTAASIIQIAHRFIAVVFLVFITTAVLRVKRQYPALLSPVMTVAGLFLAEFALGVFNVLAAMPLWTNTLHNLLAVGLLFATIDLMIRVRFRRPGS